MRVLSLDLGTKTGWAMLESGRIESGMQDFTKKRGESNGMLFLNFNRWLANFNPKIDLIVFEQPHHRGGAATEIAVNLAGRVTEFCARYGIEHTSVHSLTLKKWATGTGKADKAMMIERACQFACQFRSPYVITDDNEADAILLLHYAIKEITGERMACDAPIATTSAVK